MEDTKAVSIVIAAEFALVRDGLASLCASQPNFEVRSAVSTAPEALRAVEALRPDIVILDLQLPGMEVLEIIRKIRAQTATRVIVLSPAGDRRTVLDVLRAGALGFLLKSEPARNLFEAIPRVSLGAVYLSPELNPDRIFAAANEPAAPDPLEMLSGREYQVFLFLVEGLRAKEIAARLELSPKTVDTYRASLMRKLEIFDIAGLVKYAISRNLTALRQAVGAG